MRIYPPRCAQQRRRNIHQTILLKDCRSNNWWLWRKRTSVTIAVTSNRKQTLRSQTLTAVPKLWHWECLTRILLSKWQCFFVALSQLQRLSGLGTRDPSTVHANVKGIRCLSSRLLMFVMGTHPIISKEV